MPAALVAADGGDVAACYLNGAGTSATTGFAPGTADASSATAACGSQAAGVVAILICFGCDGQFAGGSAAIALFVVLEAGMFAVAGEGIVALERDRRVARALDAEGGVVVGLNVDILQRHVEGAVFDDLLMIRMTLLVTFSAVFLKFSAAVFKAVVDSFRVSSSSLASATLRDGPVYVIWLSSTGLLLGWVFFVKSVSFFSPPVVPPVWFSFSSPPPLVSPR